MPSFMNRSCQRQTQVFDLPVRRMISLVPTPSALERMIAARQACFCEALRSLVIASSRPRTDRVIVMEIPVRMHQTRTATETGESQSGLFCQAKTTRFNAVLAARAAEGANDVENRDAQLAQMQKTAYPDMVPVMTALPVRRAFNEALHVAKSMPGWIIVAFDVDAGRIEASHQSRWFRFTDDIVIRVVGDELGSRIDMRSTSRQGQSDYGVNATRIRAYKAALRKRIGVNSSE